MRSENYVLAKAMDSPTGLDRAELCAFHAIWWPNELKSIVTAAPFGTPFESFFASADGKLNLRHSMTCGLIRLAAAIRWHKTRRSHDAADIGYAEDRLNAVARSLHNPSQLNSQVKQLSEFLRVRNIVDLGGSPLLVGEDDYIPVSNTSQFMTRALNPQNKAEEVRFPEVTAPFVREFGFRIQTTEPEEAPEAVVTFIKKWKADH